jgi:hypothetical protein
MPSSHRKIGAANRPLAPLNRSQLRLAHQPHRRSKNNRANAIRSGLYTEITKRTQSQV